MEQEARTVSSSSMAKQQGAAKSRQREGAASG